MNRTLSFLAVLLATAALAACSIDDQGNLNINVTEQEAPEFRWEGALGAGRTLEIKGVSGNIDAKAASGNQVQIVALRKGRSDPEKVKIEVVQHDGGVTVCAVYPTKPGDEPNVCKPGGEGHLSARGHHTNVTFNVQVPAGVRFVVRNTNGTISAQDLKSNLDLTTTNGSVRFSTDGYAQASTTNGEIKGTMQKAEWTDALSFNTVNGSIQLALPASLQASVDLQTVNGGVSVDFPLTRQGEENRRHLTGVVGSGGRELKASAVNGSVRIRKIGAGS